MKSFWLLLFAFLASSLDDTRNAADAQCDWTPEKPQKSIISLPSLSLSKTICHNNIMTLYDDTIKFPFATYAMHKQEQMSKLLGGRKDFVLDPLIPVNEQHAVNDTVFHSPYSRGHLTPSYIMSYDKSKNGAWEETYYISNILPQTAKLNEGAWEKFEMNIIDTLEKQPNGTIWEIYTGGFWNGKFSFHFNEFGNKEEIKDYLFWKAFCNRQTCNSAMITAYHHQDNTYWSVKPINHLLRGLFPKCCPNNNKLDSWKILLNGVAEDVIIS